MHCSAINYYSIHSFIPSIHPLARAYNNACRRVSLCLGIEKMFTFHSPVPRSFDAMRIPQMTET